MDRINVNIKTDRKDEEHVYNHGGAFATKRWHRANSSGNGASVDMEYIYKDDVDLNDKVIELAKTFTPFKYYNKRENVYGSGHRALIYTIDNYAIGITSDECIGDSWYLSCLSGEETVLSMSVTQDIYNEIKTSWDILFGV